MQVPTSYIQDLPSRFFFSPTSRSSQGSEGFFFRRATYKVTYVDAVELRQGWSVAKNKWGRKEDQGRWSVSVRRGLQKEEKKKTKEGGLSPQEGDVRKETRRREGGSAK